MRGQNGELSVCLAFNAREWSAGTARHLDFSYVLSVELLLSPFELLLSPFELLLSPFELLLSPFELLLGPAAPAAIEKLAAGNLAAG
eukprot:SAG31_NODE_766_length_12239_cov_16.248435_2_plen_87_part_00